MNRPAEIKDDRIAQLRREILALQGLRVPLENELRDTGLGIINQSFPNNTFPVAAVHEFISSKAEDRAATTGFISGLLGTLMNKGACLWVSTRRSIFPPALKLFGIAPDQVIFVDAASNKDALWMIEEGLKCPALASVVGEIAELSFTESRRLQLAVEQSRTTGFIHRHAEKLSTVACVSRWMIRPLPSENEPGLPGIGFPSWDVELMKMRNGHPGRWQVRWMPKGFQVATPQIPEVQWLSRKTG